MICFGIIVYCIYLKHRVRKRLYLFFYIYIFFKRYNLFRTPCIIIMMTDLAVKPSFCSYCEWKWEGHKCTQVGRTDSIPGPQISNTPPKVHRFCRKHRDIHLSVRWLCLSLLRNYFVDCVILLV